MKLSTCMPACACYLMLAAAGASSPTPGPGLGTSCDVITKINGFTGADPAAAQAVPLDTSNFRYNFPLNQFPNQNFVGGGGPSPHAEFTYAAVRRFLVPTFEKEDYAIRAWLGGSDPFPVEHISYFYLPTGRIVTAEPSASTYTYNVSDPGSGGYAQALKDLTDKVQAIASGVPGFNSPNTAFDVVVNYLKSVAINKG